MLTLPPSKLPQVGTTIFTVMSRLAQECGAINLSQGFPDFDPPQRLVELAGEAMRSGVNQYAPMAGWPALLEAIGDKVRTLYGCVLDPAASVTVTAGATEALFCAVHAVVRPGDEVILLEPAYDSYEPAVALAGGRAVRVPLVRPDFHVDWDRVRDAITSRTRLLIVNSPHNPTGAVLAPADLDALAEVLRDNDVLVLSDEVYEHIVFDDRRHLSLLARPALAARSFVVSSFGKTFHCTGWKVGYCVAPPALTAEFRKVHQFVQFAVAAPLQAAFAKLLVECPEHARGLGAFYQAKRDRFRCLLAATPLRAMPAAGTYFQLADYSAVSDQPDVDFARWLSREIGVAAIPISVFSATPAAERVVRFCFAKNDATLEAAGERLAQLCASGGRR
ncbi:MAG: pyridoxal phosphate-dependent aminotransferase [Steroidobacteraceae bacterium]|nr:pyridoxal phosphate-dependent aminotransferase [Steroidobacteraceae bacterium]